MNAVNLRVYKTDLGVGGRGGGEEGLHCFRATSGKVSNTVLKPFTTTCYRLYKVCNRYNLQKLILM